MNYLVNRILERQPDALWMAREMGSGTSPEVLPLTKNEDPGIRALALRCLNQSGGDGIERAFIDGLKDSSPMVRAAAVFGLQNHLNEGLYLELIAVYNDVPEGIHRRDVAIIIGRLKAARLQDIQTLKERESDPDAVEGLLVAAAKLGDLDDQARFGNNMRAAKNEELLRYLSYTGYISQTWTLQYLRSILENTDNLEWIGSDRFPEIEPQYLRACDIAVDLIAEIAGARFSFSTGEAANYTDSQLEEVRDYVGRFL